MPRFLRCALLATLSWICLLPARAQQRKSPHETISAKVDAAGDRITVVYGRPYTKDPKSGESRKIWGGLVPYNKIWRLGADEATLLATQAPLELGHLMLPPGAYTLYFFATDTGAASLLVNKEVGQWGLVYHPENELGRVELQQQPLAKRVDQFTIAIENGAQNGGVIKLSWEQTQYAVPFTVRKAPPARH